MPCSPWRATARVKGPCPEVRPPYYGLASIQRDKWAVGCAARRGASIGYRPGRQRRRSEGIPIGPALLGLDRASAETEFQRRQAKARQHQQARGSLSAQPIHCRRASRNPYAKIHGAGHRPWLTALLTRRSTKVAAVALANKIARMAWAMMAKGERYREPVALAA